jgi:arylsulfatase A-like enzyme
VAHPAGGKPNIVVIVIDTLRADHLPFYGYSEETAPFLGTLAEEGTLFERVWSTSSWTAPATASLFTSVYPQQHGVVTGRSVTYLTSKELGVEITLNRIPAELETLPEAMKRAGYRTFGVSDNFNVCDQMGFADGFDTFSSDRKQYIGADHVVSVVENWRRAATEGGPYFLYIHFMDPHKPYHAQRPWYRHPAATPAGERPPHLREMARADEVARYDSEIAMVDDRIRRLYEGFGWKRNTIFVVTSDHGEEFWDHGYSWHDKTLYEEVLRVPLLVHDATGTFPAGRFGEPASIIDVLPTLAAAAGIPPDPRWMGRDLAGVAGGEGWADEGGRSLFAHLERRFFRPWGAHGTLRAVGGAEHYIARAAIRSGWKLILDTRDDSRLFDIGADPAEIENRFPGEGKRAAEMKALLKEFEEAVPAYASENFREDLSAAEVERLRSLGYVN